MNVNDIGRIPAEEGSANESLGREKENEGGTLQESGTGLLQEDGGPFDMGEDQENFGNPISEDDQIRLADEGVQQGIDIGFFSVNGYRIKKDYPKVFKDLLTWINGRSQVGELDENFLIGSLAYSPRTILPEFFDEHKLYVNTAYIEIGPSNWKYTITEPTLGVSASTDLYTTRVHAEVAGYSAAFKKLENTLT